MILQGNVKGWIYPVTQKPYEPPDPAGKPRKCAECGRTFDAAGRRGAPRYCSSACRRKAHSRQARASFYARMARMAESEGA